MIRDLTFPPHEKGSDTCFACDGDSRPCEAPGCDGTLHVIHRAQGHICLECDGATDVHEKVVFA